MANSARPRNEPSAKQSSDGSTARPRPTKTPAATNSEPVCGSRSLRGAISERLYTLLPEQPMHGSHLAVLPPLLIVAWPYSVESAVLLMQNGDGSTMTFRADLSRSVASDSGASSSPAPKS